MVCNKNYRAAHCTATVLDFAYAQYSVQWQKIGNMQSSASSILTVISIIASLMVGVISQISDVNLLLSSLGSFSYSFYLAFLFAFIYLFIAGYFVFSVIKPKSVDVVKYPVKLQEILISETQYADDGNHDIPLIVDSTMLLKVNEEIVNIHDVVEKNQKNYNKCLVSSFFSLLSSFIALGHVVSPIFKGNIFIMSIVGILGYLCILGLIYIFREER